MSYQRVTLKQGSRDWMLWRHKGVGASDAPVILGENPWKSKSALLREKSGPLRDTPPTEAMRRGTALEPEARAAYEKHVGGKFEPVCLESASRDWQRASLDGLSRCGSSALEIKCGQSAFWYACKNGVIPPYYVGQLQHILAVTDLDVITYWGYLPARAPVELLIHRNNHYIKRLIQAENEFWDLVQHNKRRLQPSG
jgi:putative phage-type endonuclease